MTDQSPSLAIIPSRIDADIIPRWLVEHYDGAETEIAEWFTSFYFWKKWNGNEETLAETIVLARAHADAKWEALKQTGLLKGATSKSIYYQLYEANRTGWFRYINEVESLRELIETMLAEEIERDPDGGTRYEYEFILKTMIPTMESLGVPKEQIFSILPNISKAKAAVPVIRQLVASEKPEAEKQIMEVFAEISNGDVSVRDFKQNNAVRMGKTKSLTPTAVPGGIYLVPGSEFIVIESDRQHTTAIQIALRGIVSDLTIKDGGSLLRMLSQKILPKTNNFAQVVLKYVDDVPIIIRGNGYPLPTPDDMAIFAFQETARSKFYLDKEMAGESMIVVPAYTIMGAEPEEILGKWLQEKFDFTSSEPITNMCSALKTYYTKIHPDMASLYPNCKFWMEAICDEKWGLVVYFVATA